MATDDHPPRFDTVDWDAVAGQAGYHLSVNTKGTLAATGVLVALLTYDALLLGRYTPTFAPVGWGYDVSGLDWLFAFTLVLFGFYLVLPLYQHPRMTRYYWREFKRNRPAVLSLLYLVGIFLLGLLGPLVISSPEVALFRKYQPPLGMGVAGDYVIECVGPMVDGACRGTLAHPLGTTQEGQDVFRLVVYGMQISM